MNQPLYESSIPGLPAPKRGKVRDIYDLGNSLLLVATDRISAFDCVFPTPVPDKGRILTALSLFWFDFLADVVPNHLAGSALSPPALPAAEAERLNGRAMLVRKAQVVPFECIVRGYLAGSGWKEYERTGSIGGIDLPPGLGIADKLPEAVFTPSTKAEAGHDENVPFSRMADRLGREIAGKLRDLSLALYAKAARLALERGIIVADCKFEFGFSDGELILVDEALTPDSSRFWPLAEWKPGVTPPSFDKQPLRDWVERNSGWNKSPPAPPLPEEVVMETRARYIAACEILTGRALVL